MFVVVNIKTEQMFFFVSVLTPNVEIYIVTTFTAIGGQANCKGANFHDHIYDDRHAHNSKKRGENYKYDKRILPDQTP